MTPNALESAARDALAQITPTGTIGEHMTTEQVDNIATLRFSSVMPGYVGWDWVVSLAIEGEETQVLETELLAGEGAVVSPDWVPWADRLREYEESIAAGLEAPADIVPDDELDDDLDDDDHDVDESDDDDDDDFDDDVDDIDLTDVVESRFDDTDVFDGVEEAGSVDDGDDEYVVTEDD